MLLSTLILPRCVECRANGMWNIQEKDKMKMEDYGARVFTPSHYSDFIKARTGHDFGTVHVPTPLERPEVLAMIVSLLAMLAYVGWKVYTSRWIGHPAIWTAACLFVFAFAASGVRSPVCLPGDYHRVICKPCVASSVLKSPVSEPSKQDSAPCAA